MKKISIIVPCYNVEEYLRQCLDSIVNQTYTNLEIICVNDGSTDNTLSILNEYASNDNRIAIVNQKNTGLSGARNAALKRSTGEYIVFVDSDDYIELNTCKIAINEIEKYNSDIVLWNYVKEYKNKSINKLIFENSKIIFDDKKCKNILHRRMFGLYKNELNSPEDADTLVTAWGKMYKSNIILENKIEFVDTKLIGTEDALFNAMAFENIHSAVYIPNCLNHYRKDNENSLTTIYKSDLYDKWNTLFNYLSNIINENGLTNNFKIALNNRIALSIIGLGLNELANPKGPISQIKNIHKFLKSKRYKEAYKNLELKYFPIHWKCFFFFVKHNMSVGVYVLLKIINLLRGKYNE